MPFASPILRAALSSALVAQIAHAYTQVNVKAPFMFKNVDPILYPGQYNESHLHSFFGSDRLTASTNSSGDLQRGCTNAQNPNDLSSYWTPTLLYTKNGGSSWEPVPFTRFSAYYNLGETPAEVPIPQNLKMVAGKSSATKMEDSPADAKVSWFCEGQSGIAADSAGFPSSTCSTHLQTLLYFPQCVNPQTLETSYKKAAHGTTNRCPAGQSTMPQLRFSIRYNLRQVLPDGWSGSAPVKLACGNAWCSHGDFINGWTVDAAKAMVATTQAKQEFSPVDGSLGRNGEQPSCRAADADPKHGTSDYATSVAAMQKSTRRSVDAAEQRWRSRYRSALAKP